MKDIVIKATALKRELYILLAAFMVGVLINLYAIITRDGSYIELITQIGWTMVIGVILYALLAILRGIFFGITMLFKKVMPGDYSSM